MSSKKSVGITLIKRLKEKYAEMIETKYDNILRIPNKELKDYKHAIARNISDGIGIHANNNYPEVISVDNINYINKWTEDGYKDQIVLTITFDPEYHNHVMTKKREIDEIGKEKLEMKNRLEEWELNSLEKVLNNEADVPIFKV